MKRELPILFNTDMVCSVLDNLKTATRRVIKPQPKAVHAYKIWGDKYRLPDGIPDSEIKRRWTPPCNTDDSLWVRETWCNVNREGVEPDYYYFADTRICEDYDESEWVWRPSIHMPKAAARIWLKVTGVTVERLQDMTLDDFLSEGVVLRPEAFNDPENAYWQARDIFRRLWDSTIPKAKLTVHGWDANPWVWAINFERCEKPVVGKEAEP